MPVADQCWHQTTYGKVICGALRLQRENPTVTLESQTMTASVQRTKRKTPIGEVLTSNYTQTIDFEMKSRLELIKPGWGCPQT